MKLSDVQDEKPQIPIPIDRVGFKGVRMPAGQVNVEGKQVVLMPVFEAYIDLPANQRAIHASRNYEPITEVIKEYVGKPYKLEDIAASVARELLKKHPYAKTADVRATATAVYESRTPATKISSYEPFTIFASAKAVRNKNESLSVRRNVGIEVSGLTACPCAQQLVRDNYPRAGSDLTKSEEPPLATHMQRSHARIMMEVPDGYDIDVSNIVSLARDAMSAGTFEVLKREDEVQLVIRAAESPRFVEDCVRFMAKGVVETFGFLPGDTRVHIRQRNQESVHSHDLIAEKISTLERLAQEISEGAWSL